MSAFEAFEFERHGLGAGLFGADEFKLGRAVDRQPGRVIEQP